MKLFQRLFFAAVLAGLAAGLVMTGIQQWRVAPLIHQAEVHEDADAVRAASDDHVTAATGTAAAAEHREAAAWTPADGIERAAYTVLADLLAGIGFAFLLAATSTVTGLPISARNGIVWGLCGFVVFHLAPAFGLPPELPGMPAAPLFPRQVWWWGTALSTAAALFLIARRRRWTAIAGAAVLLLAPHLIGAPKPPDAESSVPAELATTFAASALTASAAFWLVLGPLYGWLFARLAGAEPHLAKGAHA